MKFNEWKQRIQEAQEKLKNVALNDISESIFVDGSQVLILMGRNLEVELNGHRTDLRYLRQVYTRFKPEFDIMLESLEEATKRTVEATQGFLNTITDKVMPELVVKRLSGEDQGSENIDILNYMAGKKMYEIAQVARKIFPTVFYSFKVGRSFMGSGVGGELTLVLQNEAVSSAEVIYVGANEGVGTVSINGNRHKDALPAYTMETNLYFLSHADAIRGQIARWVKAINELEGKL